MRRMMRRMLLPVAACLSISFSLFGATEAQKEQAILRALQYIVERQSPDGSWYYQYEGDQATYGPAVTGAAVLAIIEAGYRPGEIDPHGFGAAAERGLEYLVSHAFPVEMTTAHDRDGNGVGVVFSGTEGNNGYMTYLYGLAGPPIALAGTPRAVVESGPLAERTDGTGPGGGWTYTDLVANAFEYLASYQNAGGGWGYSIGSASDNSNAQWPIIAFLFGRSLNLQPAREVADTLKPWIESTQGADGRGQYVAGSSSYGAGMTGAILIEMAWVREDSSGNPYDLNHPNVRDAVAWLDTNWSSHFGSLYSMWAIYKGLRLHLGPGDPAGITNFYYDPAADGVLLDEGDEYDWWEDYCEYLVRSQSDGTWASTYSPVLEAAWAVNILASTTIGCGGEDRDGDGWGADCDCDDFDAAINPGVSEVAGNGLDDDCDGLIDE